MLAGIGRFFAEELKKWLPDSFVFALVLTLVTAVMAFFWLDADVATIADSWYRGFWLLLEFGMQVVLILVTGYAIALSAPVARLIDWLATKLTRPGQIYVTLMLIGGVLTLVSWSWVVLVAVLGRELAKRVEGIDYAFLVGCIYMSSGPWVGGLSSSIPLLLNTPDNFLIEAGLVRGTIPISETLLSPLNLIILAFFTVFGPLVMFLLRPRGKHVVEMKELRIAGEPEQTRSVAEEARSLRLKVPAVSDKLNHAKVLQLLVAFFGLYYVIRYFLTRGFDINLEIMIFLFVIVGLIVHTEPIRYVVAMRRAAANISGIVFQYPFYAGIMGLMMFTGLGSEIARWLAGLVTLETLPLASFILGGAVNFSIPSAGGEWAVIGPALVESAAQLGTDLSPDQLDALIARIAMAVAYGESLTNLLQPFFLLVILPVLGAGVRVQARDVMGYVFLPFLFFFTSVGLLILLIPL